MINSLWSHLCSPNPKGEKHNQKVKMYLESQRAVGTMSKDSGELKVNDAAE
jgi:hypothetical protein